MRLVYIERLRVIFFGEKQIEKARLTKFCSKKHEIFYVFFLITKHYSKCNCVYNLKD